MPKLLAFDTSTDLMSVGVLHGEALFTRKAPGGAQASATGRGDSSRQPDGKIVASVARPAASSASRARCSASMSRWIETSAAPSTRCQVVCQASLPRGSRRWS